LQDEFNILIEERARLTETLRAAKALSGETQGFSDEAKIQAERLESIGLFEQVEEDDHMSDLRSATEESDTYCRSYSFCSISVKSQLSSRRTRTAAPSGIH
jgi:hypothetical protein